MVTMADIAGDVAVNPDAQAAVTDFLDYTEYLPADLIRSLTLIRSLDEAYLTSAQHVDNLTRLYGGLPSMPPDSRLNARKMRLEISTHLDQALSARESSYAEACRLFDLTDRHQNRLQSIIAKLHALPKPPSRDPTPPPQPPSSAKRSRSGRKLETGIAGGTRLTIKPPKGPTISILNRPKHRRVTVPGEVMPPFDPDEPMASTEVSDYESEPSSPVRPIIKFKPPKPLKAPTQPMEKEARKPRETAVYRKPTPPPEDAEIGSKYRPWTHLTEYEMYKLRKKMKKNHTWEPSDVMIRRELAEKGRGWDNYYKIKAEASKTGTKFNDLDTEKEPNGVPEKVETPKTTPSTVAPSQFLVPKIKPARKSEPRREKKEDPVQSRAALAAQEAELAARRLGDIGSAFKNLFSPFSNALASLNRSGSAPTATSSINTGKKLVVADRSQKKRKVSEAGMSASPSAEPEAQRKKQKTAPPRTTVVASTEAPSAPTIKIPLKLTVNPRTSPTSSTTTSTPTTRPPSAQPSSVAPKLEATSPSPSRPPSRRSMAASVEPQTLAVTRPSRRASATPGPMSSTRKTPVTEGTPKNTATAASRRSKRDAPGTVTQSSQDGGAAVSVSKRKSRPNKSNKGTTPATTPIATTTALATAQSATATATATQKAAVDMAALQIRIDIDGNEELVDPDEERYCVCGDVSWGEMICCELDDKCEFGHWFHMECIGLVAQPPRTAKWYCPGDRKKYHKGETSNGLVGRNIK